MVEIGSAMSPRTSMLEFVLELASGSSEEVQSKVLKQEATLDKLIAGFALLRSCEQGVQNHLEGNALVHTAKVFAEMARLTTSTSLEDRYVLLIAALVHDIEKPSTRAEKGDKVTFYGHAEKAADRNNEFVSIFKLTQFEAEKLHFLVRNHMSAHLMRTFGERARAELYSSIHFPTLTLLQEADAISSWKSLDGSSHAEVLKDFYISDRNQIVEKESANALKKLIYDSATDELAQLGVAPGRYFGVVKAALEKEDLRTSEEARAWARGFLVSNPPAPS